jgi:hypothetical protein
MDDTRFWNSVEKLENRFLGGELDEKQFRSAMRRKGFDAEIINERVEAVRHDWQMIYGRNPAASA